jgi:hypothetical protein
MEYIRIPVFSQVAQSEKYVKEKKRETTITAP